MADFVSSVKRFALIIALLIVVAFVLIFSFDQLISAQAQLTTVIAQTFRQTIRTAIVAAFGLIIVFFIRRSKSLISKNVGTHLATMFQFFMILIVGIVMTFAVLNIFEVSPTTLLVGGGVVSIVIGLVISTFVGNILAGH